MAEPFLELCGLAKNYGEAQALGGIDNPRNEVLAACGTA